MALDLTNDEALTLLATATTGIVAMKLHREMNDAQQTRLLKTLNASRAFAASEKHAVDDDATDALIGALEKLAAYVHGVGP